ncbi:MAG: hypothetical protein QMB24_10325, partial [Spirosomataceae bacterium]
MNAFYLPLLYWSLFTVGGYMLGFLLKKYILPRLSNASKHTTMIFDDAIVLGMQRVVILFFTLTGFSFGYAFTNIFAEQRGQIGQGIV